MKVSTLFLVAISCIAVSYALDCPDCDKSKCSPHGVCSVGIVTDVCGCCDVCAKNVGEECGGPWNVFGLCGSKLVCLKKPPPPDVKDHVTWYFNQKGRCVTFL
ncbi:venom protein 302-like [Centruroides vittatus]|uniref:venom protein 302-like n=1 Tax=Centruroides vittatus TaxID=120091 RepID=UPI00350FA659